MTGAPKPLLALILSTATLVVLSKFKVPRLFFLTFQPPRIQPYSAAGYNPKAYQPGGTFIPWDS